jgi:adenylate kinase family enzyme
MLEFEIVPLHTAVLAYEKRAVLLFGNSGAGKTTLELSLLNSGFSFFSDDIAFLDEENHIYNSGERIVACKEKSEEIINKYFDNIFDIGIKNSMDKSIIRIRNTMVSEHNELIPFIIIFPTSSIGENILKRIQAKVAFIELIKLTISSQFSSAQKQLYMKRLKHLSETAKSFKYFWATEKSTLKETCSKIRALCDE